MTGLLRRWLCRRGHHEVVRCAGAADHTWTWNDARQRWTADVPRPASLGLGEWLLLLRLRLSLRAADQRFGVLRPPAGKNDLAPVAARHRA